jgi:hypothetical protein
MIETCPPLTSSKASNSRKPSHNVGRPPGLLGWISIKGGLFTTAYSVDSATIETGGFRGVRAVEGVRIVLMIGVEGSLYPGRCAGAFFRSVAACFSKTFTCCAGSCFVA